MQSDMTRGNPLSIIIRFTIPLFIGNVFQQLYNMCDTIIVGRFVGQSDSFRGAGGCDDSRESSVHETAASDDEYAGGNL